MTVPATLEPDVVLSLESFLAAGGLGVSVLRAGMNATATSSDDDWIEVHLLSTTPVSTRATRWAGTYLFQITCVSRTANDRTDTERFACWDVAGAVRTLLQPSTGKGMMVSQLTGDSSLTAPMTFPRIDMTYIPDYSAGGGGAGGVPDQPTNLHAVALTCLGVTAV